jgi:hypothetical protein
MESPEKLRSQGSDKFIIREISLLEHPMKQRGGGIATMLMAYSYLEDGSVRKDFFPGLVLFRSNQQKPRFLRDFSEVRIGKWHPSGKQGLHIFLRSHLMDGSNKRGVWRTIGAFAEPLVLFHVLFGIIDGHLNEVLKGGLRGVPLCGQIKFRADDDVSSPRGFNNRCQSCGAFFQDDGHNRSCIKGTMRSKGGRGAMPSGGADATAVKVQRVKKSKSQWGYFGCNR